MEKNMKKPYNNGKTMNKPYKGTTLSLPTGAFCKPSANSDASSSATRKDRTPWRLLLRSNQRKDLSCLFCWLLNSWLLLSLTFHLNSVFFPFLILITDKKNGIHLRVCRVPLLSWCAVPFRLFSRIYIKASQGDWFLVDCPARQIQTVRCRIVNDHT